jgi:cell filamentation protein
MYMEYKYEYIDPDHKYTDPATGILRNLLGITNKEELRIAEYAETTKRTKELRRKPSKIRSMKDILAIHKHLFANIYKWAGEAREVDMEKESGGFHPHALFAAGFQSVDNEIAKCRAIDPNNKKDLATALAKTLDTLNALHPFREGNGRTQRLAMEFLSREKGYALNLNPNNEKGYRGYMDGTINGDKDLLAETLMEQMIQVPSSPKPNA